MNDKYDVYLRPLREEDAKTSWRWRNDSRVWEKTGSRPNCHVTEEMELDWMRKVLADKTSRRYAIVLKDSDRYIGNIYLTEAIAKPQTRQVHPSRIFEKIAKISHFMKRTGLSRPKLRGFCNYFLRIFRTGKPKKKPSSASRICGGRASVRMRGRYSCKSPRTTWD